MKKSVLVIFEKTLSSKDTERILEHSQSRVVVAYPILKDAITALGLEWINIEEYIESGSIYRANMFVQELSLLKQKDGLRIAKSILHEGYELWWIHYNSIFVTSCLPYTQYERLLALLKSFQTVYLFEPPHKNLFTAYLQAFECEFSILRASTVSTIALPPFGIFIQILLTLISLPFLMVQRKKILIFTGDKFAEGKDYDSRMSFIYEEMRDRKLPFIECIRSLESWKIVLAHAIKRRRPILYSVAIASLGRVMSVFTPQYYRRKKVIQTIIDSANDSETRFKVLLATQYMKNADIDISAIRITKWILRLCGVKSAYITAAVDRNFHTVLASKLLKIPTVGILHGTATRDYIVYDFLPTFDGEKLLTLDKYGLWSEWWKEYYEVNSRAYQKEQLFISGPMRPLTHEGGINRDTEKRAGPKKVLFISEQLAAPEDVVPYIQGLLAEKDMSLYMKFRPYRDGFEMWLMEHHPEILAQIGTEKILRGGMQEAIATCDVVVGSHSTAVLEALLVLKPIVFFATQKWGDCFELTNYHPQYIFYAENIQMLVNYIQKSEYIPESILQNLQERFFGNPYQNGSAWVVDQLVKALDRQ